MSYKSDKNSMNGYKMEVGDVVYDVLKGAGKVIKDGGGKLNVVVRFGENDQMSFTQDGKFNSIQRLFWTDPFLFPPESPNDQAYLDTLELAKVIYEKLKRMDR